MGLKGASLSRIMCGVAYSDAHLARESYRRKV